MAFASAALGAAPTVTPPPLARGALTLQQLETLEAVERLAPEWRRLADRAAGGFPFRTYEWNHAWWTHLHARGARVRDRLAVVTARTPDGELVAVAPLMRTERPGAGPVQIRALEFFGADPNITEVRGLVCAPGWDGAVAAALLDHVASRAASWDVLCWRGVHPGSEAHAVLATAADARVRAASSSCVLPLPRSWAELRSTRHRNLKESLRKCYNSLRRDGYAFTLDVARDEAAVAAALARFFVLHRARARLKGTVAHPDVFAAAPSRAFLADVCARLARRDMVRIFELRIAGAVVATRVGFAMRDVLYLYFSGYDPVWRRYSVMTTCVAEAIRWAIEARFAFVNLSSAADVAKMRWSPEPVELCDVVQVAPGLRAHVASHAYALVGVLRAAPGLRFLRR